jgi:hypothetical protein
MRHRTKLEGYLAFGDGLNSYKPGLSCLRASGKVGFASLREDIWSYLAPRLGVAVVGVR